MTFLRTALRLLVSEGLTMPKQRFYGACYYCICTACAALSCPFSNWEFKHCTICRQRRENRPRLDCDFFQHYIKHRHFRFRRVTAPLPAHSGTYVLITDKTVFVGSWAKLEPLRNRYGGQLKKIDFLDFLGGHDYVKR